MNILGTYKHIHENDVHDLVTYGFIDKLNNMDLSNKSHEIHTSDCTYESNNTCKFICECESDSMCKSDNTCKVMCDCNLVDIAFENDQYDTIVWLYERGYRGTSLSMLWAVCNLEDDRFFNFLNEHGYEIIDEEHNKIICELCDGFYYSDDDHNEKRFTRLKWLHENGFSNSGAYCNIMNTIARANEFEVFKWLHNHGYTCTSQAIPLLLEYDFQDVVDEEEFIRRVEFLKWIYENCSVGCDESISTYIYYDDYPYTDILRELFGPTGYGPGKYTNLYTKNAIKN